MNRVMSRATAARAPALSCGDFGIGNRSRVLHKDVGVDGLVLDAGFGFTSSCTVCLVDPGLIIGLRQAPMGRHVLGINGERAPVGGDCP